MQFTTQTVSNLTDGMLTFGTLSGEVVSTLIDWVVSAGQEQNRGLLMLLYPLTARWLVGEVLKIQAERSAAQPLTIA